MAITNASQLSVFTTIRDLITANSILNVKFNNQNIYQFEPLLKSFKNMISFPYIVINVPEQDVERITVDNSTQIKDNNVIMFLVMEHVPAETYFVTYANALLNLIDQNQASFTGLGFGKPTIILEDTDSTEVRNNAQIIRGTFVINFDGVLSI